MSGNGMMAPARPTADLAKVEKAIEYIPFGAEDRIKLSVSIVRNIVAVPTREGDLPEDRDCMRFLMLCQAGRLNPFAGDCFLVGYRERQSGTVNWSLITAISAFWKRAETHPEYDGCESGCIVLDKDGNLRDRVGDFTLPTDTLVGGWAKVYFKSRTHPMEKRVKLETYQKPFGVWKHDPAGMICKCAEAHALRDSFPTMCGGLYVEGENPVGDGETTQHRSPTRNAVKRLDDLNAAIASHPTDDTRVIDHSTNNLSPDEAEQIINNSPRAAETQEPDVSGTDAEPPQADETPDVSSEAKFIGAATEIAIDKEVSESVFNAAIAKLRLSDGIGGGRSKDTATRAKLWRAMVSGRFDWQTAKITG